MLTAALVAALLLQMAVELVECFQDPVVVTHRRGEARLCVEARRTATHVPFCCTSGIRLMLDYVTTHPTLLAASDGGNVRCRACSAAAAGGGLAAGP
jgi:hypothetical protein